MTLTVGFTHQSQQIGLSEWITLLTLCLAPLIAHIIAGVPLPTYLHNERPHWHDRICLYNPTSILWRYFAITDRRVRAKSWNSVDMSASNALFWTACGWDGSEKMIERSQAFCTRAPSSKHIDAISASAATTIIVTLQGVQALYDLLGSILKGYQYSNTVAVSTIFFPLATFGLLRLPAALWLTDDYAYRNTEELEMAPVIASEADLELISYPTANLQSTTGLLETSYDSPVERFHPPHSWRGITVRLFFLLIILGLYAVSLLLLVSPWSPAANIFTTTTNFTLDLFYQVFLSISLVTMAAYILLGRSTTTIIPCICSRWYKIYTCFLFAAMLIVITIAALETRRTPCGRYTTFDKAYDNNYELCGSSTYVNAASVNTVFGLAVRVGKGIIRVSSINGWCQLSSYNSSEYFLHANSSRVEDRAKL